MKYSMPIILLLALLTGCGGGPSSKFNTAIVPVAQAQAVPTPNPVAEQYIVQNFSNQPITNLQAIIPSGPPAPGYRLHSVVTQFVTHPGGSDTENYEVIWERP